MMIMIIKIIATLFLLCYTAAFASASATVPIPGMIAMEESGSGIDSSQGAVSSSFPSPSSSSPSISSASSSSSSSSSFPNPIISKLKRYQTVTPVHKEHAGITETIMANLEPGDHPDRLSFTIHAYGRAFELKLKKTDDLFHDDYKEIRVEYNAEKPADAVQHVNPEKPVHCYYHGTVEGDPSSSLMVSTCGGLRGHIRGYGEEFSIEPAAFSKPSTPSTSSKRNALHSLSTSPSFRSSAYSSAPSTFTSTSHPLQHGSSRLHAFPLSRIGTIEHVVYRVSDLAEEQKSCGVSDPLHNEVEEELHGSAWSLSSTTTTTPTPLAGITAGSASRKSTTPLTNNGISVEMRSMDQPASTPTPTPAPSPSPPLSLTPEPTPGAANSNEGRELIELLVFNDYARWTNKGEGTEADTLAILNSVKEFYKTTIFTRPTRIVLVGQVTFTQGDPYNAAMTSSGVAVEGQDGLLNVFHDYRSQTRSSLPQHNNGQLFSERRFTSNIMGLAGVGSMCSQWSGSICCMTSSSMVQNAMISAHETGHTLSMLHDGSPGAGLCPNGGYIMATTTGTATTFSTCSIQAADTFMVGGTSTCMYQTVSIESPIESQYRWRVTPWSSCSATCGLGAQTRQVECVDVKEVVHPALACEGIDRPQDSQRCTTYCGASAVSAPSATLQAQSQQANTNEVALIATAATLGFSLALLSFVWVGLKVRRCREAKLLQQSDKMSSDAATVTEPAAAAPGSSSGASEAEVKEPSSSPPPSQSPPPSPCACPAPSCLTHKTPRSVPRTIQVS